VVLRIAVPAVVVDLVVRARVAAVVAREAREVPVVLRAVKVVAVPVVRVVLHAAVREARVDANQSFKPNEFFI